MIKKSEIRKDYFLPRFVIITPGRGKRPRDIKEETVIKRISDCPFCQNNINEKEIVEKISFQNKSVICLKNAYPAVTLDNPSAYGKQEVIVETKDHAKELADLSLDEIAQVLSMYARRTKEISKNKKINYILCLKNQGSKAGATIVHAHSQIFASAILPPDIEEELNYVHNYQLKKNNCPYCDIIRKEEKSSRKVYSDQNVFCFTPYASEFHYEAWIFTKKHSDNIGLLKKEELKSLAKALKIILVKLQKLDLSFNLFLHNVVSDKNQHVYIKIQPRDSVWGGVELGSGLVINSILPEEAAKYYRQ